MKTIEKFLCCLAVLVIFNGVQIVQAGNRTMRRACVPCQVECLPCTPASSCSPCEPANDCRPNGVVSRFSRNAPVYVTRKAMQVGPEISLIQNDSLAGWITLSGKNPPEAWSVKDGVLHLNGKGGDIMTEREYENFMLDFTWTISKGGNSGIKYRFKKFDGKGWLGPEYQVLDDFNTGEGKKPKNNASSLYDILAAEISQKHLNPHDQENHGRIVVHGDRLEHWINGKKVVDITAGSDRWNELVAQSKFNNIEGYGMNSAGRIMIQDHQCEVRFHKISIREIFETEETVPADEMGHSRTKTSKSFSRIAISQSNSPCSNGSVLPTPCGPKTCHQKLRPSTHSMRCNFRGNW